MASKKKQNEEVLEQEVLFQDGDYFSATYKGAGMKKGVKIRGIVEQRGIDYTGKMKYSLTNNQDGYELDCDHEFSFAVDVYEATTEGLTQAHVTDFEVLTDKRLIKVIENDKLPEIAGYRAKKDSYGEVSFGCGAVSVTKEEIKIFLEGMERLKGMKGRGQFFEVCDRICEEESVSALIDIDLKEVTKLLERLN